MPILKPQRSVFRVYAFPEEWRAVIRPQLHQYYEVSNWGRVRRVSAPKTGIIVSVVRTNKGYHQVTCQINRQRFFERVHVLVLEAFIGPRPAGMTANHKDGDKLHNTPDNLEWISNADNHIHAAQMGLIARGQAHWNAKLCENKVRSIRLLGSKGYSSRAISQQFGISHGAIGHVLAGRTWRHVT